MAGVPTKADSAFTGSVLYGGVRFVLFRVGQGRWLGIRTDDFQFHDGFRMLRVFIAAVGRQGQVLITVQPHEELFGKYLSGGRSTTSFPFEFIGLRVRFPKSILYSADYRFQP